ncbi:unnamed protein product [Umbelopsis vinacea]
MPEYKFNVAMSCSGCSNAVSRALNKLNGVQNVNCNLDTQLVTVDTTLPKETVLAAIEKTGKAVSPIA